MELEKYSDRELREELSRRARERREMKAIERRCSNCQYYAKRSGIRNSGHCMKKKSFPNTKNPALAFMLKVVPASAKACELFEIKVF